MNALVSEGPPGTTLGVRAQNSTLKSAVGKPETLGLNA